MPSRPPKPCTKAGCTKYATIKGRCDAHQIKHGWDHKATTKERGYGSDWRKLRAAVLERDGHICKECIKHRIYTPAKTVDHVLNKAGGGTDDMSNLQSLCNSCHNAKTQQEALRGRNALDRLWD